MAGEIIYQHTDGSASVMPWGDTGRQVAGRISNFDSLDERMAPEPSAARPIAGLDAEKKAIQQTGTLSLDGLKRFLSKVANYDR